MFSDKIVVKIKTLFMFNTFFKKIVSIMSYLHTYSIQQSTSWDVNRFSIIQEIYRILWNPNVHYSIHNFPPPVTILSCLLENVKKRGRGGKATNDYMTHVHGMVCAYGYKTHSEYVTLIAFPRQQWLCEHTSMLRL